MYIKFKFISNLNFLSLDSSWGLNYSLFLMCWEFRCYFCQFSFSLSKIILKMCCCFLKRSCLGQLWGSYPCICYFYVVLTTSILYLQSSKPSLSIPLQLVDRKINSANFEMLCVQEKPVSRHLLWDGQESICTTIKNTNKADLYSLIQTVNKSYGNQVTRENKRDFKIS